MKFPAPNAESDEPLELSGEIRGRRSNGRTEIGIIDLKGTECVVKFRPPDDIHREIRGWLALTLHGYQTVPFFRSARAEGRACIVSPAVGQPLLYDLCLRGDGRALTGCIALVGRQFRNALTAPPDSRAIRLANAPYFAGRVARLERAVAVIRDRLGAAFLNEEHLVNGCPIVPVGRILEDTLRDAAGTNALDDRDLVVTHGDPGELATAFHWQLLQGPVMAPRYHANAYPGYALGASRPSLQVTRIPGGKRLSHHMEHRVASAREVLRWYGPESLVQGRPQLAEPFARRFQHYWAYRCLTIYEPSVFSVTDLEAICLTLGYFSRAANNTGPQAALERACDSLLPG
jgi:hypothetical protein